MKKIMRAMVAMLVVLSIFSTNFIAFADGWDTDPVPIDICDEHTLKEKVVVKAGPGTDGKYYEYCTKCSYKSEEKLIPRIQGVVLTQIVYTYDGTKKTPGVYAKDNARKVIDSKYYDVTYQNNSVVGRKTRALITFKGRYTGAYYRDFTIKLGNTVLKTDKTGVNTVKLSWTKVPGAKYYRIYELDTKGVYQRIVNTTKLTYTLKNRLSATRYNYRVRAYYINAAGKEVLSDYTGSGHTEATTLPEAPKATATVSGKDVYLSWNRVPRGGYYRVFRYDPKTGKYITLVDKYGGRTFVAQNQPKGTNYYLVRAYLWRGGASPYSTKILTKAVVK